MGRILLNRNSTTGAETWYEFEDGMERAMTEQDVDSIMRYANEMRAVTSGQRFGEMRRIGVMPMAVLGQAMREGWAMDQNRIMQWLRENPVFRTFDKL